MHPDAIQELARSKNADYEQEATRARLARQAQRGNGNERQSLRMVVATRAAALAALFLLVAAALA